MYNIGPVCQNIIYFPQFAVMRCNVVVNPLDKPQIYIWSNSAEDFHVCTVKQFATVSLHCLIETFSKSLTAVLLSGGRV